jgi:hypothetical protein
MCCEMFVADDCVKFFTLSLFWTNMSLICRCHRYHVSWDVSLSHNSQHCSLGPFRIRAGWQHSPLFHFAVSWGPRVSVRCIADSVRSVHTIFIEGAGNAFLLHAGTRVHGTSKFCNLSEPTGSDWRQLSDEIMSVCVTINLYREMHAHVTSSRTAPKRTYV